MTVSRNDFCPMIYCTCTLQHGALLISFHGHWLLSQESACMELTCLMIFYQWDCECFQKRNFQAICQRRWSWETESSCLMGLIVRLRAVKIRGWKALESGGLIHKENGYNERRDHCDGNTWNIWLLTDLLDWTLVFIRINKLIMQQLAL